MNLSEDRKNEIENKANNILEEYKISPYTFNVLKFIRNVFDFEIDAREFKDTNVTGILLVDDDNPVIGESHRLISINSNIVNGKNGFQRSCFIALHELAHFLLHKKDHRQFAMRDTDKRDTVEEKEADYFATCMLMPKTDVQNVVDKCSTESEMVETVCRLFRVTPKKAIWRLKDLKLIKENY